MKFFKGKLLVALLIIIIGILAPVVHGEKTKQAKALVYLPVFFIVLYQHR